MEQRDRSGHKSDFARGRAWPGPAGGAEQEGFPLRQGCQGQKRLQLTRVRKWVAWCVVPVAGSLPVPGAAEHTAGDPVWMGGQSRAHNMSLDHFG